MSMWASGGYSSTPPYDGQEIIVTGTVKCMKGESDIVLMLSLPLLISRLTDSGAIFS